MTTERWGITGSIGKHPTSDNQFSILLELSGGDLVQLIDDLSDARNSGILSEVGCIIYSTLKELYGSVSAK